MIIILTNDDLKVEREIADVTFWDFEREIFSAMNTAEDVYFWRDGKVKALKRLNHPLVVPDWLKNLEGVDQ